MAKDLFKKALKASLTELLEIEVTAPCNPADDERTVDRDDSARVAACAPEDVLPAPSGAPGTWEPAFVQVVAVADVLGVSTRTVDLKASTPPSGSMR